MNTIIVSDLHIGSKYFLSHKFDIFLRSLPEYYDVVLNGDVIENPYKKLIPSHQRILDRMVQESFRRNVIWVRGNHDNGFTMENPGKICFRPFHTIEKQLLIAHGDDFDEIMPRSRLFIKAFKFMHNIRVKLGAKPVHVAHYAKKWKLFYKVLRNNVMMNAIKCARENGYEAVTCGHTHYSEDVIFNGTRYINTGAWTEIPISYLLVKNREMTLKTIDP
ncbi:MAG: hypothetical protein GTN68_37100 [Candidatus Aminicenantes bacterium]|nr:hypothetical protein [Candidatus Aminicenantes bacterium]